MRNGTLRSMLLWPLLAGMLVITAARTPPAKPPDSLQVLIRSGSRALPVATLNGQEMVPLADLASVFQLTVHDDAATAGLTVTYKGKTIVLSSRQALASVSGRLVALPAPAMRDARGWFVPLDFISRALALVYDTRLELRKPSRLLIVGDLRVPRVTATYATLGAQARVAFEIAPETPYTIAQEPGRLMVRFRADAIDARLPESDSKQLIEAIRIADGPTTIAIQLGPKFGSYRSADQVAKDQPARLTIDVLPSTAAETIPHPTPTPTPEPSPLPDLTPASSVRTVVIDPGHGGDDTGVKGVRAVEKDITIGVARRLKALLEARLGVRVLMTREGDQAVALDDRASMANNNKADVFLSLHANASVRRSVSGAEVYYVSLEEYGEEAGRLATTQPPTLPVFGGGTRQIDVILWDLAQASHIEDSAALARIVDGQLGMRIPVSAGSLQQAPLRVLVGANMPAVLVELGFMTNAEQEQQLVSDAFQNAATQALFESVLRFRDYLDARRAAPSAGTNSPPITSGENGARAPEIR
ncbi:MAG: N-acetylmuramoyl-L-alanine amidase [Acidobacteria bacterium]|nr:N-acetylmuramoyl-L-alanine amidase [Acidobacteriota bacterium]